MLYQTIDILGTIAFAISGVLVAMEKRLDLFGVLIIMIVYLPILTLTEIQGNMNKPMALVVLIALRCA